MTGLDKMINQIRDEAKAEAEGRVAAVRKEAQGLAAQAAAESEAMKEAYARQAEEEAERYLERVRSLADMKRRMTLLQTKQEIIAGVLEKAYEKLDSLDVAAYFDLIRRLLVRYAQPLDGEICFSQRDRMRLPSGFEKEMEKIAAKKGGTLRLADPGSRDAAIENGFILVYGGVEENCTFRALFDSRKEELQDVAQKVLFS